MVAQRSKHADRKAGRSKSGAKPRRGKASRADGKPAAKPVVVEDARAVVLKEGRERPVMQGHPWVFSGAVARMPDEPADGDQVSVRAADGRWLAAGLLSRNSQIPVRVLSRDPDQTIDAKLIEVRLRRAVAMRQPLQDDPRTNAYRLVNAEGDLLPGLVVDRYGDYLVVQIGTHGMERRKAELAEQLLAITDARGVVQRGDAALRRKEGLEDLSGLLLGELPSQPVVVRELDLELHADLLHGQKGGLYLDQRDNRRQVARWTAGAEVLNAFSYTGTLALHALKAGASKVVNLDSSAQALAEGELAAARNGLDATHLESVQGDVFRTLREWCFGAEQRRFDCIVLDPPKFAPSRKHLERALRGYKDINLLALKLLRPGGTLATFSCSSLVSPDLFHKVVHGAAVDAGKTVQILQWMQQGWDHPVPLSFPEGAYLKGLICRVL